jgi:cytochrome c-type biogenesis protein CcmH/NrfG
MSAPGAPSGPVAFAPRITSAPAVAGTEGTTPPALPIAAPAATAAAPKPPEPLTAGARTKVSDEPSAPPTPSVASPVSQPRTPTAIKSDARRLIGQGRLKDGIAAARAALAADPSDAEIYLLLGAALQDNGQWSESAFAFASCVQQAKRGPINECRALRH